MPSLDLAANWPFAALIALLALVTALVYVVKSINGGPPPPFA